MNPDMLQLIRDYKNQNLSDDDIAKRLSTSYPQVEIMKGLAALQYMRPANQSNTALAATVLPNDHTTEGVFKIEVVKGIIDKRKRGARSGVIITILVLIGTAWFDPSISMQTLIIVAIALLPPLSALYSLNARNYIHLQPSYRTWNTWVYDHGSRFLIINSVFSALSNIRSIANPMHGFKDASAPSKTELLIDTAVDTATGVLAYSNLKPAAYVEQYFKQNEAHKS